MKICEHIGPGFLTSVEFLHRKVAWNAEGFSGHTIRNTHWQWLTGLVFNGKKQLEQTKWKVAVAPESKTVVKVCATGADGLDEQETQQYRSLIGTALHVGQDRPRTQYATKRSSEIRVWTNACREVCAQTFVQVLQRGTLYSAGVFHIKKCQARSGR